ncbi:MAG TPA: dipeptidyl carboxypeptidase II, partial [Candidatus Marinimicrobia bacterium]|nr:dipeptidyl carboxypeptidase II [Candidatus Neomarinimicrobiota bacterium]
MKFGILFTTASAVIVMMILSGCATSGENAFSPKPGQLSKMEATGTNPFYQESTLYFKYPPFDKIKNAHYAPAFGKGMTEQLAEIEAIAGQSDAPTFENTIVAMEKSGQLLNRVATVFYSLASAHTNDSLETVRSEMAPKLSAHSDQILLNSKLFERIRTLYDQNTSLDLDAEAVRLVEETYKDFIRAGANLSADDKEHLKTLNAELATQQTTFSQNVLKEVNNLAVVVDSREELTGLSETMIEAAAKEAESRDLAGKYVITLQNTSGQPPLSSLENRDLRERIHKTSLSRGSRGGEFDNREGFSKVVQLRAERAQLLGYKNNAAYILEKQT